MSPTIRLAVFGVSALLSAALSYGLRTAGGASEVEDLQSATADQQAEVEAAPEAQCPQAVQARGEIERLLQEKRAVEMMTLMSKGQLETEIGVDIPPPDDLGAYTPEALEPAFEAFVDGLGFGEFVAFDCDAYPCTATMTISLSDPGDLNDQLEALREGAEERWPHAPMEEVILGDEEGNFKGMTVSVAFSHDAYDYESLEYRRMEWMMEQQVDANEEAIDRSLEAMAEEEQAE
jgi:hypothetical protein